MNETVTKRFLLYFRLMLLVWILIANAVIHLTGMEYSWLIFLSNIMMFTLEGDVKDRLVTVELGGLVGLVLTVAALLSISALTPVLGDFLGFILPLAVVLFILIILHPYAPKVLNNVGFAYHLMADAKDEAEFNKFVATCKELSFYDTGITPVYGDKLLCLSTCEYTIDNGRFVVAAVRIS